MPTDALSQSARALDLSARFAVSTAVVASPAAAAETIVASVTIPGNLTIVSGVYVGGWLAYTIGTSGTACEVRLRQTNVAGAVKGDTGPMTGGHNTAGQLVADDVNGFDTTPVAGGVYVMTLQVTAGAAISTVSAVMLFCLVV